MFKLWIVFPAHMQPTVAQMKRWYSHSHELRGVHWGTERDHSEMLAVETEATSLQALREHCESFDSLIESWLRSGAEIRDAFDFEPDRNALQPCKSEHGRSPVKVRFLPNVVAVWEPRRHAGIDAVATTLTRVVGSSGTAAGLKSRLASKDHSRTVPWLLAGAFAIITISVGLYVAITLNRSSLETRRETIQRIDDATRKDPRDHVDTSTRK
ncbi:MAG: hypothetical protein KDA92_08740 [Planctomycetales bacterium]|nr:hypothetical protein [Planctomycetales bacterium]